MPMNCGLEALSKLGALKNASAFTLVHLARDNGMNLHIFEVKKEDLVKVARPAIFHQANHFVYVKEGEAMPLGDYSGFVIGPTALGRVVSHAEAKFIKGEKNFLTGQNKDGVKEGGGALGSILGVVGAIVGTVLLPGVGTALGANISSAAGGAIGGAIGGGVGAGVTGDNALLGAAGGALGGYGIGSAIGGASAAAGASSGGSALNSSAYNGAFNAAKAGAGTSFSAVPQAGLNLAGQVGATNAITAGANAAAAGAGTINAFNSGNSSVLNSTVNNAASNTAAANNQFSLNPNFNFSSVPFDQSSLNSAGISYSGANGGSSPNSAASNAFAGAKQGISNILSPSGASTAAGGAASGGIGLNLNTAATAAGAVGLLGSKPPDYTAPSPQSNYSAISQFLGPNALADASKQSNLDYVNTSIPDLQKQFTGNNTRVTDAINTSYNNQKDSLVHAYAQAGQNLANSSELQTKVAELEQKRTNDITLANQELQDQALGQAIQVKQTALSQGMQSGQWNQSVAMQLASLTGDQQNLQYAIANNDYTSFQQIMGKLLTMGIPQTVKLV